jgi:hypothetical protein
VRGVKGHNTKETTLPGSPRPLAEELHKIFGGIPVEISVQNPSPMGYDHQKASARNKKGVPGDAFQTSSILNV